MKILEVRNLIKHFTVERFFMETKEKVKAVDDVSLSLDSGRILAVVGESGSGKTTLARLVAGLEEKDSGEIIYRGEELNYSKIQVRRDIQYIFQDTYTSLNPRMKIKDILAEPMKFHFNCNEDRVIKETARYLSRVNMPVSILDKYPYELSGGQRQRMVIARALTMQPRLLIADEPVSSLDVSVQAQILKLLAELNKRQRISLIFITHDLRIVRNLADEVIVMKDGKIVEEGRTERIYSKPKEDYTKNLLSSIPNSPYKY